ncbi:hypothetical protein Q5752_001711 [Cryptotrichosporon argae]
MRLLVAFLALTSVLVAARPAARTNADRIRRGLPPLPPKRFYEPSKTRPELSRRSAAAPTSAALAAYYVNEEVFAGYVSFDSNKVATLSDTPATFTFAPGGTQEQMYTTLSSTTYNLGAVLASGSDMSDSSGTYAQVFATTQSDDGAPYTYSYTDDNGIETSIWTVAASEEGAVDLVWTNDPDAAGNPATTTAILFYSTSMPIIQAAGSLANIQLAYPSYTSDNIISLEWVALH